MNSRISKWTILMIGLFVAASVFAQIDPQAEKGDALFRDCAEFACFSHASIYYGYYANKWDGHWQHTVIQASGYDCDPTVMFCPFDYVTISGCSGCSDSSCPTFMGSELESMYSESGLGPRNCSSLSPPTWKQGMGNSMTPALRDSVISESIFLVGQGISYNVLYLWTPGWPVCNPEDSSPITPGTMRCDGLAEWVYERVGFNIHNGDWVDEAVTPKERASRWNPATVDWPTTSFQDNGSSYTITTTDNSSTPTFVNIVYPDGTTGWHTSPVTGSKQAGTMFYQGVDFAGHAEAWKQFYYSPSSGSGSLRVTISPSVAVSAGALWKVDSGSWNNSGDSVPGLSVGSHTVYFNSVTGWAPPGSQYVTVNNGQTTSTTGTYSQQTGSLQVMINPSSVVSAGAQWGVDGGSYHNSGDVVAGLTPGLHTVSFKSIAGYTAPASHSISITGGNVTSDTETYSVVAPSTYTLTLNAANGSISPSPLGNLSGNSFVYSAGNAVALYAGANPGYHFTGWSGDASGNVSPTIITMNGNKNVTANFASGDPSLATVIVTIQPPAAVTAGVTWGFNANESRASGSSATAYPYPPNFYYLVLHSVDGWVGPSTVYAALTAGQTTNITVTFTQDSISKKAKSGSPLSRRSGKKPRSAYWVRGTSLGKARWQGKRSAWDPRLP